MNSISKQVSWAMYFTELNNKNIHINEHAHKIVDISKPNIPAYRTNVLIDIAQDRGDSILLFYCTATKTIKCLHSIDDIGCMN